MYALKGSTVSHTCARRYTLHSKQCRHGSANVWAPASRPLLGPGNQTQVAAFKSPFTLTFKEGYTEIDEIRGIKVSYSGEKPLVEYLAKWKDGQPETWEPENNLSEDVIRDYEAKWWNAARKGEADTLQHMLAGGHKVLALAMDENRRSALHFTAALGNVECCKMLVEAGADVNLQDKEGYTPLHMAAGYMATPTMALLLEAGADPTIRDSAGRDVVGLTDGLRSRLPASLANVQQRLALESVVNTLNERLYDEVEPTSILATRIVDGSREFLVSFGEGCDDEWIPEAGMGADVVADWDAGLEYATAVEILDVVQVGHERRFKVRWADAYPTSWEAEEHVPADLIALFAQENPDLFQDRTAVGAGVPSDWPVGEEGMSRLTLQAPQQAAAPQEVDSMAVAQGGLMV